MSVASASTTVKFHDFLDGKVLHNYQPGTQADGSIRSISWSKDGNWLTLVPHSGAVEIVSVKDQLKLIHTIQGIEEPSCAAFQNTTKKNIAVGTKSGQVLIYDIKARSVKKRFPRTTSAVTRVECTSKDNHVMAACQNGEAFLYSNVTNSLSGTFKIPRSQSISALRTNPIKRNYVVAGSSEGVVAVWDIHGSKNKFFMGAHKAPVTAVAFSPINADLVVSTGFDRQFCFYDIGANKCIGSIFVENSMTSVDFSPDGKFVVMGSQRGNIYVYDAKNIQQPLHSFFGHSGCVEHLAFRKSEEYESSVINLSVENVKESNEPEEERRSSESFGVYLTPGDDKTNAEVSQAHSRTSDASDSFMAAVGLDQNNTMGSVNSDFSLRTSEGSKKLSMYKQTPTNINKMLQEKIIRSEGNVMKTSTPNCLNQDLGSPISSIGTVEPLKRQSEGTFDKENLGDYIKDTIRDELTAVSQDIKNDMQYYTTHILTQTRQMTLDLLMAMVGDYLKIENYFNSLRADLTCDLPQNQDSPLQKENLMLKQRIAVLEEEVALLKSNRFNNNNS